jgi:ABC-type dipeptide/oligopeptide/nickel transport system permease subunit
LNAFGEPAPPSRSYLLGTDELGRDVLSRTIFGARISLEVAIIGTSLIVIIGVALGMLAGYYRGWADTLLSRMFDVMLAFPVLLLALGLAAACSVAQGCIVVNYHDVGTGMVIAAAGLVITINGIVVVRDRRRANHSKEKKLAPVVIQNLPCVLVVVLGVLLREAVKARGALIQPGLSVVLFIIIFAGIPYMARIIRGLVLSIREKEYVEAMHSLGASDRRILFLHILPNLAPSIIVYATLLVPLNILFEAALSFLGIGIQPPTASWGQMIAAATPLFDVAWWYMTFPGVALVLTVLSFNLLGDALQDALQPRSVGR